MTTFLHHTQYGTVRFSLSKDRCFLEDNGILGLLVHIPNRLPIYEFVTLKVLLQYTKGTIKQTDCPTIQGGMSKIE